MRNSHPDFPEIPGEPLMERRLRWIIWKERKGIKTGTLRNSKRITVKALQRQIDALEARVKELEQGAKS